MNACQGKEAGGGASWGVGIVEPSVTYAVGSASKQANSSRRIHECAGVHCRPWYGCGWSLADRRARHTAAPRLQQLPLVAVEEQAGAVHVLAFAHGLVPRLDLHGAVRCAGIGPPGGTAGWKRGGGRLAAALSCCFATVASQSRPAPSHRYAVSVVGALLNACAHEQDAGVSALHEEARSDIKQGCRRAQEGQSSLSCCRLMHACCCSLAAACFLLLLLATLPLLGTPSHPPCSAPRQPLHFAASRHTLCACRA